MQGRAWPPGIMFAAAPVSALARAMLASLVLHALAFASLGDIFGHGTLLGDGGRRGAHLAWDSMTAAVNVDFRNPLESLHRGPAESRDSPQTGDPEISGAGQKRDRTILSVNAAAQHTVQSGITPAVTTAMPERRRGGGGSECWIGGFRFCS